MKTLRMIGSLDLRILCAAFLILFCSACGKVNSHCYLCGAPPSAYPCIVELSTGQAAELRPAEYGTAAFSNIGFISLSSGDTMSMTAAIPAEGEPINRTLFCDRCLAMLDSTPNNGYILADLHDPSDVEVFGIEDGAAPRVGDYNITVYADGERLVLDAERAD